MALKDKYASVLALGEKLGIQNGRIEEGADGVLRMWGTAADTYQKDQLWDAIKAIGGAEPSDIAADIQVATTDYYTKHTVVKGDSLSKIAKHYYDDMMKYNAIFDANRDQLSNPDEIEVGQVLIIPNIWS
ncbi:MAG: LysM peptidoglycan-binding domain-containing protein [Chitinophagales bacterium]|nr:LysM peptidoglycan-binding domain-containing protein [Chitinophagales bacterium]